MTDAIDMALLLESIKYDITGKMSSLQDEVALTNKLDQKIDELRREVSRMQTHFDSQLTY
jgi:hypothetical protein|tara:strand:+ start:637 stop:816 length:180 start_codon:yes stop_codon:yes gene_type:complete